MGYSIHLWRCMRKPTKNEGRLRSFVMKIFRKKTMPKSTGSWTWSHRNRKSNTTARLQLHHHFIFHIFYDEGDGRYQPHSSWVTGPMYAWLDSARGRLYRSQLWAHAREPMPRRCPMGRRRARPIAWVGRGSTSVGPATVDFYGPSPYLNLVKHIWVCWGIAPCAPVQGQIEANGSIPVGGVDFYVVHAGKVVRDVRKHFDNDE